MESRERTSTSLIPRADDTSTGCEGALTRKVCGWWKARQSLAVTKRAGAREPSSGGGGWVRAEREDARDTLSACAWSQGGRTPVTSSAVSGCARVWDWVTHTWERCADIEDRLRRSPGEGACVRSAVARGFSRDWCRGRRVGCLVLARYCISHRHLYSCTVLCRMRMNKM